jgi:rhamnosyltransferase
VKVAAVVVCYLPDERELRANLAALEPQVDWVILVNNGPRKIKSELVTEEIYFGENLGVATAQNAGIKKAMALNADAVLLLDQDSRLYDGAVTRLQTAVASDSTLAAVGLVYRERHTNRVGSFFKVRWWGQQKFSGAELAPGEVQAVDFLIASGSLIPVSKLIDIGLMREDFFIDYIDTEWCIRAVKRGHQLAAIGGEMMSHALGDDSEMALGMRRYPPDRQYYFFRNGISLMLSRTTPPRWKWVLLLKLLQRFMGLPVGTNGSVLSAIRFSARGLRDGIRKL